MKKETANKRTEDILNSFDGIQTSAVPPFFYTRLKARMQREAEESKPSALFQRPAFLVLSLSVVLIMNIIFLSNAGGQKMPSTNQPNNKTGIQAFADAYDLNGSSIYE